MCSAEGWQSREELPVSEACWTTYTFRAAAPVCQRGVSTNPLCSHYLPDSFFFFPFSFSHLLPASRWSLQLQMFVPAQFSCLISHIWSLSAVCWSMKVWTTVGCQGQRFERRKVTGELILTSPSPQRLGNTWRVFGHRGFLFSWAWSFGFEMKQEKTHTFNVSPIKIMLNHIFETAKTPHSF